MKEHADNQRMAGLTVKAIYDNDDREVFGDDPGFTIEFTDGSKFEVSAGMGQGCGFICDGFKEDDDVKPRHWRKVGP